MTDKLQNELIKEYILPFLRFLKESKVEEFSYSYVGGYSYTKRCIAFLGYIDDILLTNYFYSQIKPKYPMRNHIEYIEKNGYSNLSKNEIATLLSKIEYGERVAEGTFSKAFEERVFYKLILRLSEVVQ